ncbi:TrbI/VirB10 family protein [Sinimarinibacterium sp. NLF-5-8]|uniref:TrbI/VirB10 family protein n=1 Tax=Sinimarinibacterium sp. NLF-5-8 TaxID=2698684 RepID=UPI00137C25E3|nr:TrbI/VirB10 family protein [Sinimarinibacterium sp. NLF-5-8]QHS09084.1 hypothetical protein GT972_02250 [Sinimarinibacterium sp. NLF-5-8]
MSESPKQKDLKSLIGSFAIGKKSKTDDDALKIAPEDVQNKSRKRLWMVVGGSVGVLFLFAAVFNEAPPPPQKRQEQAKTVDLTPPGVLRQNFEKDVQADMLAISRENAKITAEQEKLRAELQKNSAAQKDIQKVLHDLAGDISSLSSKLKEQEARPPAQAVLPPPPSPTGEDRGTPALPPPPAKRPTLNIPPPPPPTRQGSSQTQAEREQPQALPPPTAVNREPLVISAEKPADKDADKEKVASNHNWQKNAKAGYIPAGAFAPVVLLTGVEAGTSTSASSDPQPVLMRIEQAAILPGHAQYQTASCFALGSANGSMSTERAYVRLARLTCLDKGRRLVLDEPLKGYLADSDGMFGLRGKLVERRGAVLAKSLLAGFVSGIGNAFSQAQGTTSTSALGATTSFSGSAATKSAAFGGGAEAANRLADFYLQEAQAMFPVIEVPPRRKATLILTDGSALHWADYGSLYIKTLRPQ